VEDQKAKKVHVNDIVEKLKTDVTVTAPAWAFVTAAILALVLLGVALD
jgi:hypothetical protein